MKPRKAVSIIIGYGLALSLLACGGESGFIPAANSPQAIITHQGLFIDSAVEGLSYSSSTHRGRTTTSGMFLYSDDTVITFSIGDITLGQATGAPIVSPLDFISGANETHPTVTNIARFLQTIDDDANPQNGITITSIVADEARRQSINFAQTIEEFEADTNVQTVVAEMTAVTTAGARALVEASSAQAHLKASLSQLE